MNEMLWDEFKMNRSGLILLVLYLAGVPALAEAGDTGEALAKIRQVAKDESGSYERLLARTAPLVRDAFQDQEWSVVESALKSAGLNPTEVVGGRDGKYKCVVLPSACATPGGPKFDLYLSFVVSRGRSQPTYTVPPSRDVLEATAGLSVSPLAPQTQVRKEHWFGEGTVVQEALSAWPVTDALTVFPVLESVDVSFGELGEEHQGYRLRLVLVEGMGKVQKRRQLVCSAAVSRLRLEGRDPVGNWLSRDFSPPGAAASLADDMSRVLKAKKRESYQGLLRAATHVVRRAAYDREWSVVSQELNGRGVKLISERPWDFGTHRKYLVAEKAYTTKAGQSMDLFVAISTFRETSRTAPTREIVFEAYAGLSADVQITYAKVVSEARFGEDTAIQRALLNEEAQEAVMKCPFLKSVEVYYDVIRDRHLPNSWGFSVDPEFIRGKGDESATASPTLVVPSGLDPPENDGQTVLLKDFVSKETLGDPISYGGNFSEKRTTEPGEPTSFFLTKKGEPKWRKTGPEKQKAVVAYGLGDLAALPPNTPAIKVNNKEVYDDDLAVLARFTDLQELDLGVCEGITDRGLGRLAGLKKLRSLTLSGELLSGAGFEHFRDLPALADLNLNSSKRLTDKGFTAITEVKPLNKLSLSWADSLTDDQLAQLTKLTELKELGLWGSPEITDAGLKHISTLANLEGLNISHSRSITSGGIAHLVALKNLRGIGFSYSPLTDDAMLPLSRIESLEYVEMHGSEVTGKGIQELGHLIHLKRLYLNGCKGVTTTDVNKLKASLKGDFSLEAY